MEIVGDLEVDYCNYFGDILLKFLFVGFISGVLKVRIVEILVDVEVGLRGYYIGVLGYFDGKSLDSCVVICYLE